MAIDVGKSQLHGLDLQMLRGHAVHRQAGHVEAIEDAEGDQRRDALPVGRDLVHRVVAVVLGDRRHPLGLPGRQVGLGHGAAVGLGVRGDGRGHLATVEGLTLRLRDLAQRACGIRESEALTDMRLAAMRQEGLRETGLRGDLAQAGGGRPLVLHDHRHAVAALGDLDGRLHQVGKGQRAVARVQRHPAPHGAGYGHRIPAALGRALDVGAVLAAEVLGRPGLGRAARGVQALQRLPIPQDAEHVRPEAVAARLDDGHHRRRGDRGVHRIAAALQHLQPGLRAQRVRGRDDVAGEHGGAAARVARLPVEVVGHRRGPFRSRHSGQTAWATGCRPSPASVGRTRGEPVQPQAERGFCARAPGPGACSVSADPGLRPPHPPHSAAPPEARIRGGRRCGGRAARRRRR